MKQMPEFQSEEEAREFAAKQKDIGKIKLHIHKHDGDADKNEPCEIIDIV